MPDSNVEYLKLITSEHYNKPNYYNYVKSFLDLCSPIGNVLRQFDEIFNLENAVGDQLDKLGELVGVSRKLPIVDEDIPSVLGDDSFRLVIKAKILKDHWDGTRQGMEEIMDAIFPDLSYDIVDNYNMTLTVTVIDPSITDEQEALIKNGFIIPKPSGVGITYSILKTRIFGWDRDNELIAGWETGIWSNK